MVDLLTHARRLSPIKRESTDSAIFGTIRRRLTLWYTGVLAAAILLLGIALYLGVRQALLGPIDSNLQTQAQAEEGAWQSIPLPSCPRAGNDVLVLCYDPVGHPVNFDLVSATFNNPVYLLLKAADDPGMISSTIHNGSAFATKDIGGSLPRYRLYAQTVRDLRGNPLGIVEVGQPIGGQLDALNVLLILLIVFGGAALLCAAVGGIFLADRALQPARMAYARQRDFIADASHELRTPLTILRADAEVLLRGRARLDPEDAAILEDVVTEAAHMTNLANSMLSLARLEAGDRPIEHDVVDLAELARDIAHRAASLAGERQVQIRAEGTEPVLVVGDRVLLEQAVLVLTDNAIKYNHPAGAVVLRTSIQDNRALLEVSDTGIGIAAEDLPHLGERFYRVDKARSRAAGGAGLGISIARGIATRHHGTLELRSDSTSGTIATLSLPAARNRLT